MVDENLNKLKTIAAMWDCCVVCHECEYYTDITVSHYCPKCYSNVIKDPYMKDIVKLRPIVEGILTKYPECRDNDEWLMLKVWMIQNPKIVASDFNFRDFGVSFKDGKFIKPEVIRRTRVKVQEENKELRGMLYESRQKTAK